MSARHRAKADALAQAYQVAFGRWPTKHATLMCLAVAEGETQCGDAWNHAGNWGAIQRRTMTEEEKEQVSRGVKPAPTDPFEQLHGDSSPVHGKYQTWFWAFPAGVEYADGLAGDAAGARKFLHVLIEHRSQIKALIDSIDPYTLARLMYLSGYYEGFHVPHKLYVMDNGNQILGSELNIRDYGQSIAWNAGIISQGLADWTPGGQPVSPAPGDVEWTQAKLNALGYGPLAVDGISGPRTKLAIKRFQHDHELGVDGIVGPNTFNAMQSAQPAQP